ncbi:MAG: Gfo/Idh/MocA family oxidoreductase [Clostridiales Family XIII bacterium]|jgi:predicted dehydrogenase|nr:Gfo/Idh/MocA family oxidoreductase [Clostridiales Family XIII bacterium]
MSKIFNIGVIGIGDISQIYLENLKKYTDIVKVIAVASRGIEKAQKRATEFGIEKAYASGDELIKDPDIDIVLNLTTPEAHAYYNLEALKAGKHVYTEKPLAATFAEGKEIMDLAKEKALYVGCAPDTFLGSRGQTLRRIIDDGTLGKITAASAFVVSHGHEWHHPSPDFFYQPGAGPLLDIGPYYMTALLSVLGPVKTVCALAKTTFPVRTIESEPRKGQTIEVNTDTHITALLEFVNGVEATLITSFDIWDSQLPRMEFYGEKGTALYADIDPLDGPNLFGGDLLIRTESTTRWQGLPREDKLLETEWDVAQVKHPFPVNSRGIGLVDMATSINKGKPSRASGDMALHSLDVMECILKSANEKKFYSPSTTFVRPEPLPEANSDADAAF